MNDIVESNQASIEILRSKKIIVGQVLSYRSLAAANAVRFEHCVKPARIILGDHPWYWVVSPADAERLMAEGYDPAD